MEKVTFMGRKAGSQGIFYQCYALVPAGSTKKEAALYLYRDYDHITFLRFIEREGE